MLPKCFSVSKLFQGKKMLNWISSYCCIVGILAVVFVGAGFAVLLLSYNCYNLYDINSYVFFFVCVALLGIIFLWLLGILFIIVHGIWGSIHVIFNICNFSITFFIPLPSLSFYYLLTISFLNFPHRIISVSLSL